MRPAWLIVALALVPASLVPAVAFADAVLVVRLGPRVVGEEATVVVRTSVGEVGRCRTDHGTCRITGVPGGSYDVVAISDDGASTAPHPVVVPPSGEVQLILPGP